MGNSAGFFCFWESEGAQLLNQPGNQIPNINSSGSGLVSYGTTEDFNPMQEKEAHPDQYILRCKLSHNKNFLATCSSDRSCKIWKYDSEVEEFKEYKTLSGHSGWVWDCDFTIDCVYCFTVSTDMRIRIWKIDEAKVKKVINGHTKGIISMAFKDVVEY